MISETLIDQPINDIDYNYHSEPLTKEDIEWLTYEKRLAESEDN